MGWFKINFLILIMKEQKIKNVAAGEMAQAQIHIAGRVQGVFFRQFARTEGKKMGLVGMVENTKEGGVNVVVQGQKVVVENYIKLLKIGPPTARVHSVTIEWQSMQERFLEFVSH